MKVSEGEAQSTMPYASVMSEIYSVHEGTSVL